MTHHPHHFYFRGFFVKNELKGDNHVTLTMCVNMLTQFARQRCGSSTVSLWLLINIELTLVCLFFFESVCFGWRPNRNSVYNGEVTLWTQDPLVWSEPEQNQWGNSEVVVARLWTYCKWSFRQDRNKIIIFQLTVYYCEGRHVCWKSRWIHNYQQGG